MERVVGLGERLRELDQRVLGRSARDDREAPGPWARALIVVAIVAGFSAPAWGQLLRDDPAPPLHFACAQGPAADVERVLGVDVEVSRSRSGGHAAWETRDGETVLQVTCEAASPEALSRESTAIVEADDRLPGQPPAVRLGPTTDFPTRVLLTYRNARVVIEASRPLDDAALRELVDIWVAGEEVFCSRVTDCR